MSERVLQTTKAIGRHVNGKGVDGMSIELKNVKAIVYDATEDYVKVLLGSDLKNRQDKFKEVSISEDLNITIIDTNTIVITEDYER